MLAVVEVYEVGGGGAVGIGGGDRAKSMTASVFGGVWDGGVGAGDGEGGRRVQRGRGRSWSVRLRRRGTSGRGRVGGHRGGWGWFMGLHSLNVGNDSGGVDGREGGGPP